MALTRVLLLRAASIQIARLQNLESTPRHRPQLGRSSCCGPGRSSIRDLPTGTSVCLLGRYCLGSAGRVKLRSVETPPSETPASFSARRQRYRYRQQAFRPVQASLGPATCRRAQPRAGRTSPWRGHGRYLRKRRNKAKAKAGGALTDSTPPPGKKWTPRDLQHHGIWKGHSGM
jgi:hypothetical protein